MSHDGTRGETVDSIARPTLSKVGNMTGADGMMMMSFIVLSETRTRRGKDHDV